MAHAVSLIMASRGWNFLAANVAFYVAKPRPLFAASDFCRCVAGWSSRYRFEQQLSGVGACAGATQFTTQIKSAFGRLRSKVNQRVACL
jgi:hypothetical protein